MIIVEKLRLKQNLSVTEESVAAFLLEQGRVWEYPQEDLLTK